MRLILKKKVGYLSANRKRVLALILFLAVFIVCELSFMNLRLPFDGARDFEFKKGMARSSNNDYEVLILGDSVAQISLNGVIISNVLEKKVYNFSLNGLVTFLGQYFIFRDYLESHKPPEALVIMASCDSYSLKRVKNRSLDILAIAYLRESLRESLKSRQDFSYLFPLWFRLLPSNIYGREIFNLNNLKELLKFNFNPWSFYLNSYEVENMNIRDLVFNKGNVFSFYHYPDLFMDFIIKEKDKANNNFISNGFNDYYLKKIIALANDRGIRIFIIRPIFYEPLYNSPERSAFYADCHKYLESLAAENSNIALISGNYNIFKDKTAFIDNGNHLIFFYGLNFSNNAAKEIKIELEKGNY